MSKDSDPLDRHEIYTVLSNERRTRAIKHLRERPETVELRNLADAIATEEADQPQPPRSLRQSVYNSLHQNHLPKLDYLGIIDYEDNRKRIVLADGAEQIYDQMDRTASGRFSWEGYYRLVGLIALTILALAQIGFSVFAWIDPAIGGIGFLGVFLLSIIYQETATA
jgi:hypothetical protein